jgi:hypothetical protein
MEIDSAQKSPSQRIIGAMGGVRPAARRLNKSPTTVHYWFQEGIPQRHQQLVLEVCQRDSIELDGHVIGPADFFGASKEAA